MTDNLIDNEPEKFLGKIGVELGLARQLSQPFDLAFFARRVGRWQRRLRLVLPDRLRDFEAFGEHEDKRRIDIVDAVAITGQYRVFVHSVPSADNVLRRQAEMRHLHLPLFLSLATA